MYPSDLKYTKDHEWIRLDGDEARVGITDYAQKQLGDVVYLELPEVGRVLEEGRGRSGPSSRSRRCRSCSARGRRGDRGQQGAGRAAGSRQQRSARCRG